jgi:alpha-D-ribose 1-methylphosphonate 5-triphosphate synthase subunit PhnH
MTEQEQRTQLTFVALMKALSYPGRIHRVPSDGLAIFSAIAETLIDLETSYYTPDIELNALLAPLGARARSPETALYQFYPRVTEEALSILQNAPVGSYLAPEGSATLVLGATLGTGSSLRLSGPGIQGDIRIKMDGIPNEFWELRDKKIKYPMGWEVFLVGNRQLVGLSRTTDVEVGEWHT